jgi:glycosyltransferase involved in cell wall biosynthesis
MRAPRLSLIVPTRGRPQMLQRMLASAAATARNPERLEVVLVTDEDNPAGTHRISRLDIKEVAGPPGRTMGELNNAGYAASSGEFVMLLNDDVVIRTRGWDREVLHCFQRFPDPVALIHVNDTLIRDYLCTFPILSRAYCEFIGGICPVEYERYRIDDHIEDVFNMLSWLGVRRTIYLPDVVFEHCNSVSHPTAGRVYESDPAILARDAPRFESLLSMRKQKVKQVLKYLGCMTESRLERLERITDSFTLRTQGRQLVLRSAWWKRAPRQCASIITRVNSRYQKTGGFGVVHSLLRRFSLF